MFLLLKINSTNIVNNLISAGGQTVSFFSTFESLQKFMSAENPNILLLEFQKHGRRKKKLPANK